MLFRLTQNPKRETEIIGHATLDVLAIAPHAIERSLGDYGEWCLAPLAVQWYCRTPDGSLTSFDERDVTVVGFHEADETAEYVLADHPGPYTRGSESTTKFKFCAF